jgi:hypothetical protein
MAQKHEGEFQPRLRRDAVSSSLKKDRGQEGLGCPLQYLSTSAHNSSSQEHKN